MCGVGGELCTCNVCERIQAVSGVVGVEKGRTDDQCGNRQRSERGEGRVNG